MIKKIIIIVASVIAAALIFWLAYSFGSMKQYEKDKLNILTKIDFEEYQNKLSSKETFIVDISRSSCRYCAIVESLLLDVAKQGRIPIYILDMEQYHGRDEYDAIKSELGITFVPTFYYIENGIVKYGMNSPLTDAYYAEENTPDDKLRMRNETIEKINAFISGGLGTGDVVNEEILTDTLVAPKSEGTYE